eukprot:TRINITY_DN87131_c0_g1_i1.p1 TRINITY_DN87131_c0_g1~~TRINITY_DN87131_c0_g1_i1.p1  ORF type:complete len:614 (-),score=74.95 TRINITY_DN87131_c0_g1_i1:200-2041(-)
MAPKATLALPLGALGGGRGLAFQSESFIARPITESTTDADDAHDPKGLIQQGSRIADIFGFAKSGDFDSVYEVMDKIGEGGFGKVFLARHKVVGYNRAVKVVKKKGPDKEAGITTNELKAVCELEHPHIVKFLEFYDESKQIYLVFELCEGPDLFNRIRTQPHGRLNEFESSRALRHMLKALQYCHSHHCGHFDIKPENFMYSEPDCTILKMIDLGLCSAFSNEKRKSVSGTRAYMAPEFWNGIYGPEGDIWSCGVVLFVMLSGEMMFKGDPTKETMSRETQVRSLIKARISEASETFNFSERAIDATCQMLHHDRHQRLTVTEALKHSFCSIGQRIGDDLKLRKSPTVKRALEIRDSYPDYFRKFASEPMLKKIARLAFAHSGPHCPPEKLAFQMLDSRGFGEISLSALEEDFMRRGVEVPDDLEELFSSVDLTGDGYIQSTAFLSAVLPFLVLNDRQLCRFAFDALDSDRSGVITPVDLEIQFKHDPGSHACKAVVQEVSSDGQITFDSFVNMMRTEEFLSPSVRRREAVKQIKVKFLEPDGTDAATLQLSIPQSVRGKELRQHVQAILSTMSAAVSKNSLMIGEASGDVEITDNAFLPSDVDILVTCDSH